MFENVPHEKLTLNTAKACDFVGLNAFDQVVIGF
jgi:hypothetical protein